MGSPTAGSPGAGSADRLYAPVSVVILTYNEEQNIGPCIESCLGWCDDIHLLDSGSKDRTREIAKEMGAHIYINPFESFGQQRTWAIENIPAKHKWHFHLDADERFTPEVVREIAQLLGPQGDAPNFAAFQCPSRMIFLDKWLKYSGGYPAYQVRLFHRDRCGFADFGHGQRETPNGPVGQLVNPYIHLNFSHGVVQWFTKHNAYSTREAEEACEIRKHGFTFWKGLRSSDPIVRRRSLKSLSYFTKGRSFLRFLDMYVRRLGVLDGGTGFHYCAMIATYEYWTEVKIKEYESQWYDATTKLAQKLASESPGTGMSPQIEFGDDLPKIDVMIPTLNEGDHIVDCIRSARLLGDAYVLDSMSVDATQQLARDEGAVVVEHRFENYSKQKNWGLDNLPFKGDWIFILDADERITPDLRRRIYQMIRKHPKIEGYYINRELLFMGHRVRHGGLFPAWNLRLFKRGRARYEERSVHEHMVCQGPTEYCPGAMLHVRRESMLAFLQKHIRYADMESDEWVANRLGKSKNAPVNSLFRDHLWLRQLIRRKVWPITPWRPFWRLIYMYFVRLGFLDGAGGWQLARLMSTYEYMITLFYRDKLLRSREGTWTGPSGRLVKLPPSTQQRPTVDIGSQDPV